jgi:hypothetical protein
MAKTTIVNRIAEYCEPKINVNVQYSNELEIIIEIQAGIPKTIQNNSKKNYSSHGEEKQNKHYISQIIPEIFRIYRQKKEQVMGSTIDLVLN